MLALPGGGQSARPLLILGCWLWVEIQVQGLLAPVFPSSWSDMVALSPAQIDAWISYLCPVTELPPDIPARVL